MDYWIFLKKFVLFILIFFLADYLIATLLLNGQKKFYGFNNNPDILINGSSLSYYGFNRNYIESNTGLRVSNYVRGGVNVFDRSYMINHFMTNYSNNLKVVIYELNPLLFNEKDLSINAHKLFLPFIDQQSFKSYFKERTNRESFYLYKLIRTRRFDLQSMIISFRGYFKRYDNWQDGIIDTINNFKIGENEYPVLIEMNKAKIEAFKETMDLINRQDIKVILVMMPLYDGKFQLYDSDSYNSYCNFFITYCSSSANLFFIDCNQNKNLTNYTNFFDSIHPNTKGQVEISKYIISVLNENTDIL